jgi:hypothetical protein
MSSVDLLGGSSLGEVLPSRRHLNWCAWSMAGRLINPIDGARCNCSAEVELADKWVRSLTEKDRKMIRIILASWRKLS